MIVIDDQMLLLLLVAYKIHFSINQLLMYLNELPIALIHRSNLFTAASCLEKWELVCSTN